MGHKSRGWDSGRRKKEPSVTSNIPGLRGVAFRELARIPNAGSLGTLLRTGLKDDSPDARIAAIKSLIGFFGNPGPLVRFKGIVGKKLFEMAHKDPVIRVREAASKALEDFPVQEIVFDLSGRLRTERNPKALAETIRLLGWANDPYTIRFLKEFAGSGNALVRGSAVLALTRLGWPPALDSAIELLRNDRSRVARGYGAFSLGVFVLKNSGRKQECVKAINALADALLDKRESLSVHEEADRSLSRIIGRFPKLYNLLAAEKRKRLPSWQYFSY